MSIMRFSEAVQKQAFFNIFIDSRICSSRFELRQLYEKELADLGENEQQCIVDRRELVHCMLAALQYTLLARINM